MKKRVIALLLCALVIFSFAACGGKTESVDEKDVNGVFGDFTSTDVNGEPVNADIFKGKKVTMVNIWGTFCSPCIREMPDLQKLSEDYAEKGVQLVGIVCDVNEGEDTAAAKDVMKQTGVKYLNILTSDSLVNAKLGEVMSVPETLFIDENGNQIGTSYVGSRSYEDWASIIDHILLETH